MQQIVVRFEVVKEDHGDTSSTDVHDLACPDQLVGEMELDCKTLLTVFFAPFRRSEPQLFGGQVECISDQREGFWSRRQLLSSGSLGKSEHGEGYNSSSERYDEKIDCHGHQRGEGGELGK